MKFYEWKWQSEAYMIKMKIKWHCAQIPMQMFSYFILVNVEFLTIGWIHRETERLLPGSTATKGRWNGKQIKIIEQMKKLTSNRNLVLQHG